MSKRGPFPATLLVVAAAFAGFSVYTTTHLFLSSGARTPKEAALPDSSAAGEADLGSTLLETESANAVGEVGATLQTPGAEAGKPSGAAVGLDLGSLLVRSADGYEIDEGYMPTEDALVELTVTAFLDEGFLEMTPEEARKYLPVDEELRGPLDLGALLGGLPNEDDARWAFRRSPDVRRFLAQLQAYDLVLCDLELVPRDRESGLGKETREALRRERDWTAMRLMGALEKASGYPHWRLLFRARQEWAH